MKKELMIREAIMEIMPQDEKNMITIFEKVREDGVTLNELIQVAIENYQGEELELILDGINSFWNY